MAEQLIPAQGGGAFMAYVAMPDVTPAPVVIMIQEIFGVNAEMRAKCDAMAAKGYIAVAPDLFWRLEPGVQLTDRTKEEWDKALSLLNHFDIDLGVEDLRATAHTFRGHAQSTGIVGCVGFCLGGKLAYLMATRSPIDAAVGYYGIALDTLMGEAEKIRKPLLLHVAEEDRFFGKEAQKKVAETLYPNAHAAVYSYPGVDHAFARQGGEHYDEAAALLANARTEAFLDRALKQVKPQQAAPV